MQKTFVKDTLRGINKSVSRRSLKRLIFSTATNGSAVSRATVVFWDLKSAEIVSELV